MTNIVEKKEITILFAGDSGDGMQLTGTQFTHTAALYGNDTSTFPNFPAEIRAPQGTLAGVSGFQLKFGSVEIFTPGDHCDVLVAMNAAALKANLHTLKKRGIIIANTDGFDKKNLGLSTYGKDNNPLKDGSLEGYEVYEIDVKKITRESLKDSPLTVKEIDRSKNMFVLGVLYWMYNRDIKNTEKFLTAKFGKKPDILDANIKVLRAGYNYGDTAEIFSARQEVKPAVMPKGTYRNIMGNQATALGIVAGAKKASLKAFFGSYPITPASDILHELSKHKNFGIYTYQAEDEIAAICSSIGASFSGSLGVTASSGPGIALKGEALGLAVMLELPLVVINVQRGGPSTGLPTKTEQSDLFQAMYGRNGEAPIPIIAAATPDDCFNTAFQACKIALEHMTPVFMLSDGYIANGSVPWKFPSAKDLPEIKTKHVNPEDYNQENPFLPYERDENLVRSWAIPGQKGLEHRVGGLEKQDGTGNVSYDPQNHEKMTLLREEKIKKIADFIPNQTIDQGNEKGKLLILGWGSTYGALKSATKELIEEGYDVSHAHVRNIFPLPKNMKEVLNNFDTVLMPEMNRGQLRSYIRSEFLIDVIGFNKVQGLPFYSNEIIDKVKSLID